MKSSEYIKCFEVLIAEHGDLDLVSYNENMQTIHLIRPDVAYTNHSGSRIVDERIKSSKKVFVV